MLWSIQTRNHNYISGRDPPPGSLSFICGRFLLFSQKLRVQRRVGEMVEKVGEGNEKREKEEEEGEEVKLGGGESQSELQCEHYCF